VKPKNELIVKQALRILELETENARLKESEYKSQMWLIQAKHDANAEIGESFDLIWARALAALKATEAQA